ncbi:MAG TPA: restriction endonuclease [Candidatus Aquilonibacter sp.]|nr:restriction endonuclease [Candidatus Aquilonibacter sp.]
MAETALERFKAFLESRPSEPGLKAWMAQLPPSEYVECALYLSRLGGTTFIRVYSLDHAFKQADKLSDEELFRQLAKALNDCVKVTDQGIAPVNPKDDPEPGSRFASLYNEAVRRGFQRDDIGFGMRPELWTDPKFEKVGDPEWKRFEKLVARIHIALCRDAEVKWSEKLMDTSGTERQIDVTIRTRTGPHQMLGIIQCKYEKRAVNITEVEAFAMVKKDLNAATAIMVARNGFQTGAQAKAKLHDIRLWTLDEAEKVAWREEVRTFRLRYPMFSEIKFVPAIPSAAFDNERMEFNFETTWISNGEKRITLANVIGQGISNATERCLPLPCWIDLEFPGATLELLGKSFPLERVSMHLTYHVEIEQQRKMNVPLGASYEFRQNTGETVSIAERDLPELKFRGPRLKRHCGKV